ncbi:hypothetical protein HDU98_009480 [Podochytrium sp. JEL0797]|nr:hypothetical protein HDU98_009480 [Podochytrium sp. JEL0797]
MSETGFVSKTGMRRPHANTPLLFSQPFRTPLLRVASGLGAVKDATPPPSAVSEIADRADSSPPAVSDESQRVNEPFLTETPLEDNVDNDSIDPNSENDEFESHSRVDADTVLGSCDVVAESPQDCVEVVECEDSVVELIAVDSYEENCVVGGVDSLEEVGLAGGVAVSGGLGSIEMHEQVMTEFQEVVVNDVDPSGGACLEIEMEDEPPSAADSLTQQPASGVAFDSCVQEGVGDGVEIMGVVEEGVGQNETTGSSTQPLNDGSTFSPLSSPLSINLPCDTEMEAGGGATNLGHDTSPLIPSETLTETNSTDKNFNDNLSEFLSESVAFASASDSISGISGGVVVNPIDHAPITIASLVDGGQSLTVSCPTGDPQTLSQTPFRSTPSDLMNFDPVDALLSVNIAIPGAMDVMVVEQPDCSSAVESPHTAFTLNDSQQSNTSGVDDTEDVSDAEFEVLVETKYASHSCEPNEPVVDMSVACLLEDMDTSESFEAVRGDFCVQESRKMDPLDVLESIREEREIRERFAGGESMMVEDACASDAISEEVHEEGKPLKDASASAISEEVHEETMRLSIVISEEVQEEVHPLQDTNACDAISEEVHEEAPPLQDTSSSGVISEEVHEEASSFQDASASEAISEEVHAELKPLHDASAGEAISEEVHEEAMTLSIAISEDVHEESPPLPIDESAIDSRAVEGSRETIHELLPSIADCPLQQAVPQPSTPLNSCRNLQNSSMPPSVTPVSALSLKSPATTIPSFGTSPNAIAVTPVSFSLNSPTSKTPRLGNSPNATAHSQSASTSSKLPTLGNESTRAERSSNVTVAPNSSSKTPPTKRAKNPATIVYPVSSGPSNAASSVPSSTTQSNTIKPLKRKAAEKVKEDIPLTFSPRRKRRAAVDAKKKTTEMWQNTKGWSHK